MSLMVANWSNFEYGSAIKMATPEHGTDPEELLKPSYWAHVARDMQVGFFILAIPASREWAQVLYVADVGSNFARVVRVVFAPLTLSKAVQDADLAVRWNTATKKFDVIRTIDRAVIYANLPTKDAANARLLAHIAAPKVMAAA
jgi:hypothetical protein